MYRLRKKYIYTVFAVYTFFVVSAAIYLHELFQMRDLNLNNTASNLKSVAHKNYLLPQSLSLSLSPSLSLSLSPLSLP